MSEPLPSAAPEVRRRFRPPARKLSEELLLLQERAKTEQIAVRTVIVTLGARAYSLLLILLALPFITPIPLPGLSTPFGLAIALISLRLALGQRPWLAKSIQRRVLPPKFFDQMVRFAGKIIASFERLLRPRLAILTDYGWLRQIHAGLMMIAGLALVAAFYLSTNVVVYALVGHEELAHSATPLVAAGSVVFGAIGATEIGRAHV